MDVSASNGQTGLLDMGWPPTAYCAAHEYDLCANVYDDLWGQRTDDVAFYQEELRKYCGPVLELACGTGRLLRALQQERRELWGIDCSRRMLDYCPCGCRVVHGDMRDFHLGQRFGTIILAFASIAHILEDEDRLRVFACARRHLSDGSTFVMDDTNGRAWALQKLSVTLHTKPEVWLADGTRRRVISNYIHDAVRPVIVRYDVVDWLVGDDNRVMRRQLYRFAFRYAEAEETHRLLLQAGFRSVDILGSFRRTPYDFDRRWSNSRQIFIAAS